MKNITQLVSVIIPTYKRSEKLPRAINSVLNSTYKNIEIIVVDDNDPDDEYRQQTEVRMTKLYSQDNHVLYIKHECNKNGAAARNTGFRHSKGEFIMFLDDDDEFLPLKIEKQVNCLNESDDSWGACYTRYLDINEKGKIVSKCYESQSGNLLEYELARNLFVHAGSNLMVRRSVVEELNGFDETFLRNQDVEFLVRLLKHYKLRFVDYIGLKVYVHPRKYVIDYVQITENYLKKFSQEIDALPIERANKIYKMIGLQLIRNALEKKQFSTIRRYSTEYGIPLWLIFHYFIHLLNRRVSRRAYGYNMNIL